MAKEPSCTQNHDAIRLELAKENLPPISCPSCGWMLYPSNKTINEREYREIKVEELMTKIDDYLDSYIRAKQSPDSLTYSISHNYLRDDFIKYLLNNTDLMK